MAIGSASLDRDALVYAVSADNAECCQDSVLTAPQSVSTPHIGLNVIIGRQTSVECESPRRMLGQRKKAAVLSAADRSDILGNRGEGVRSQRSVLASSQSSCWFHAAGANRNSRRPNSPLIGQNAQWQEPSSGAYLSAIR